MAALTATAGTDEVVAPIINEQIVWGETSNGLQLGLLTAVSSHIYRRGETAHFDSIARNVGKTALDINYYSPPFPVPIVTDEKGKLLANFLKSPLPLSFPVGKRTLALKPGASPIGTNPSPYRFANNVDAFLVARCAVRAIPRKF